MRVRLENVVSVAQAFSLYSEAESPSSFIACRKHVGIVLLVYVVRAPCGVKRVYMWFLLK